MFLMDEPLFTKLMPTAEPNYDNQEDESADEGVDDVAPPVAPTPVNIDDDAPHKNDILITPPGQLDDSQNQTGSEELNSTSLPPATPSTPPPPPTPTTPAPTTPAPTTPAPTPSTPSPPSPPPLSTPTPTTPPRTPATPQQSTNEIIDPASHSNFDVGTICKSTCRICDEEVSNLKEMEKHFKDNHQHQEDQDNDEVEQTLMHECKICEGWFRTPEALAEHVDMYHDTDSKKRKRMSVDTGDEEELFRDIIRRTPTPEPKKIKITQTQKPKAKGKIKCQFCERQFKSKGAHTNHVRAVHKNVNNDEEFGDLDLDKVVGISRTRGGRGRGEKRKYDTNENDDNYNTMDENGPLSKKRRFQIPGIRLRK